MGLLLVSAFTTNFQLEFLAPGEPIKNTRAVLERMTKSIDAALTRGGVAPPAAQDLVAVAGRTTSLETRATNLETRATNLEAAPARHLGTLVPGAAALSQPAAWTEVALGAELNTSGAIVTRAGAAPGRYVAPRSGYYRVGGAIAFSSPPAGSIVRAACIGTNGRERIGVASLGAGIGPVLGSTQVISYANGSTYAVNPTTPRRVYLAAGEWVSLWGYSSVATTLAPWNAGDPGQTTILEVTWDGA